MNLLYLDTTVLCSAAYDIKQVYHFLPQLGQFILYEVLDDSFVSQLPLEFCEYFLLRIGNYSFHQLVLIFYFLLLQILIVPDLLELIIQSMVVVIPLLGQQLSYFGLHPHLSATHLLNYLILMLGILTMRVPLLG